MMVATERPWGGVAIPRVKTTGLLATASEAEIRKKVPGAVVSWFVIMGVMVVVGSAVGPAGVVAALIGAFALIPWIRRKRAEIVQNRMTDHRVVQEALFGWLNETCGPDHVDDALAGRLWIGASRTAVETMFGEPTGFDEQVKQGTIRRVLKFFPVSRGHALKVTLDNDVVVSWEDRRNG